MLKVISIKKPLVIENQLYEKMLSYVSEDKVIKLSRFYYLSDVYRSLLGDLLIRAEICRTLRISNKRISYNYNENGKPYLQNGGLFFNLSHSEDWIVAIFDEKTVGIDVEKVNPLNIEAVLGYFSNEEILDVNGKIQMERLEYFYDLWTLKESYVKCLGGGLSIPLNSFTIKKENNSEIKLKHNKLYNFKQYDLDSFYKLSVCTISESLPQNIVYRDISDIMDTLSRFE